MSARRSNTAARLPEAQPATRSHPTLPGFADLDRYFVSPDAQKAEFWHLQALCGLRRAMGDRPLSQAGYERVRAALDAEFVVRRFGSLRTAHAWLNAQGFAPNAALRRWVHADGRIASVERRANQSPTRYVRVVQD